jgi:hypothetical protein
MLNNLEKEGFKQLKIPGFNASVVPSEIADKLTEVYRVFTEPTEGQKFVGFLTNIQNMWKKQATVLRPGFHIRNAESNAWTYAFKDGPSIKNAELYQKAIKIFKGSGKDEVLDIVLEGKKVSHTLDDWYAMFRKAGINTGIFARADLDKITQVAQKGVRTTAKKVLGAPLKAAEAAGSFVENTFRIASGLADMNKGLDIKDAAKNVAKWFLDYGDLTKTEQTIRKFIPFYTWMKKNLVVQLQAFFTTPGKYSAFTTKPLAAIDYSTPEQRALLPEWQKDAMAINPFGIKDKEGNPIFVSAGMPFADIQAVASGKPIQSLLGLIKGGVSPLIKTPTELAMNKSLFTGREIAQNEYSVEAVPAALDPVVGAIPDAIKQKLNIQRDANGRWNAPSKWVYAITQLVPIMNLLNPIGNVAGVGGTPYELQKAPYALAGQATGLTARPFDTEAAKVKNLQTRLSQLQAGNRNALQKTMNELVYGNRLPDTTKLAQFKKLLGLR